MSRKVTRKGKDYVRKRPAGLNCSQKTGLHAKGDRPPMQRDNRIHGQTSCAVPPKVALCAIGHGKLSNCEPTPEGRSAEKLDAAIVGVEGVTASDDQVGPQ